MIHHIHLYDLDLTPLRETLLEKLKKITSNEELILAVIVETKHEDDTKYMIAYLDSDETDESEGQLCIESIYLCRHRRGEI